MILKEIKCTHCGKVLLEAYGEIKKKCPHCKNYTHVVVTTVGIFNLEKYDKKSTLDKSIK